MLPAALLTPTNDAAQSSSCIKVAQLIKLRSCCVAVCVCVCLFAIVINCKATTTFASSWRLPLIPYARGRVYSLCETFGARLAVCCERVQARRAQGYLSVGVICFVFSLIFIIIVIIVYYYYYYFYYARIALFPLCSLVLILATLLGNKSRQRQRRRLPQNEFVWFLQRRRRRRRVCSLPATVCLPACSLARRAI